MGAGGKTSWDVVFKWAWIAKSPDGMAPKFASITAPSTMHPDDNELELEYTKNKGKKGTREKKRKKSS